MSSTNRSGASYKERKEISDYYATPVAAVEQFLKEFIYDKVNMAFNIIEGDGLVCDKTGCWLTEKVC